MGWDACEYYPEVDNRQNGLVTVPPSPCGADLNLRAHAPTVFATAYTHYCIY